MIMFDDVHPVDWMGVLYCCGDPCCHAAGRIAWDGRGRPLLVEMVDPPERGGGWLRS